MTLFDVVFSGNDTVYGLTEGAIDAAIAKHGAGQSDCFPGYGLQPAMLLWQ